MLRKLIVLATLVALVVVFFAFDLKQYLSLSYLKSQQDAFRSFYEGNQFFTIGAFFAIYVLSTALSLPGAAIGTLAAGALFGVILGTVIVSFASTVGATCAFLVARFLLRDSIQNKFGERLRAINEGLKKEGAFYLFTMRLIPLFPFFVINLVMGLTALKTLQFFWVSQLGMLPGTIVFVNAGTQLSRLESLKGILSPPLLFSFALLGIFPLITKKFLDTFQSRRYIRKYKAPKSFDYNMAVIGAGSGGLVASYIASAIRARVALIEKHKMGGDCLNTGCVPSKALIKSAKVLSCFARSGEFGIRSAKVDFEFADIMERVQRVIRKVGPHDSVERYTKLGVECISGAAKIRSPYEIEVNGRILTTKNIVIATGGSPAVPPIPGIENIKYLNSDNIWELRKLPGKFLVLGGGPIGSELAQCFQRFGSRVTIVQSGDHILPKEDIDVAKMLTHKFKSEGIDVITNHRAKRFVLEGNRKFLVCESKDKPETKQEGAQKEKRIEFDEVLICVGRRANVKGFGLEELGVRLTRRGEIEADRFLRTNYPNIYVCGDVTGPYQFTHFASHQAWYCAVNALFSPLFKFKADYRVIPWVTYTDPEVARVGLNEKDAKEKGIAYEVTTYGIDDLDRAIADEEDHGIVKILTVPGKDKILGVTVVGDRAGETFIEFVAAMKHGFGLNKILGTIHPYPTLGEANKYAAGNWKRNHAPRKALYFLEKFHAWRRGRAGNEDYCSSQRCKTHE